jgi:hypothetical protein
VPTGAAADFVVAAASMRSAEMRGELHVSEIPAPEGLAPYAIAFAADVAPERHGQDSDLGTGRFVMLHDPAAPQEWSGTYRVVCFAQAPLETEIGLDPFLADVTWSWLVDALDDRGASYSSASGTATRILSTGFGELAAQGDGAQIELRASWTPTGGDLGEHLRAWGDLLCMLAGIPPVPDGVELLGRRRPRRG